MYIFTIKLFSLVIVCNSAGDKNGLGQSGNKILELKTDVDKIGDDFENLAFDMVKQVMGQVSMFQVNGDYDTEDETEETTQHGMAKNILDNPLENTTEAGKSMVSSAKNILENYSRAASKRRPKRSVTDGSHTHEPLNCENSKCPEKTLKEQALEHQHIEDLKEEVNKLYDLVLLLRDQQKVMSLLGEETRNIDNALPKGFSAKNMLKFLNHESSMRRDKSIENNSVSDRKPAEIIIKRDDADKKSTQEELETIKYDLRTAIVALNKTRGVLALEKEKEVALENELKNQRLELDFLKVMVARLFKNDTNYSKGFFPKKENLTFHSSEILGIPLHAPKELPVPKMTGKTKVHTLGITNIADPISRTSENDADRAHRMQHARARASELEDLERLLVKINKSKKNDAESKMFELQQEGEKRKPDDDLVKKLILLQRFVAQQKDDKSTQSPNEESDLIKMLQLATKNMNKPQSKIVDDDVDLELEKLQDAINSLRPKDEWELPRDEHETRTEAKKLRVMLNKIFSQQAKQDDGFFDTSNKNHQLSPKEIEALAKQLAQAKIVGGETTEIQFPQRGGHFPGNGYGYVPPYADAFGNGPAFPSDPPNRWFGNFAQNPYGNQPFLPPMANRVLNNNNYGMSGTPSNSQYNGYSSAADNSVPSRYHYPNFGQYPSYKPMAAMMPNQHNFEANIDPNAHQSSSNFYQKLFGNPMSHNYGMGMEPNAFQGSSDNYQKQFLKPQTNQQNFGAIMDQNAYQSSSDFHQRPYGEPLVPNQYNYEANMEQNGYQDLHQQPYGINAAPSSFATPPEQAPPPIPYSQASSNSQGYKQLEVKNQFFPVPQPGGYEKTITKTFYSQGNIAGGGPGQPGTYTQQNTENGDYRHQKIEDLKTQIYSLQNVINDLNKPNYTQKPEDKETVATLEQQINELNGIINSLNQDVTPNLPNYATNPSNPPSYEQSNAQPQPANYEKPSRRRRSVGPNQVQSDEDSKLYDQVVSKVKQFFFDNQTEERSSYDDISRRIAALKNQLESRMQIPSAGQQRTFDPVYPANAIQNSYQPPYYQYSNLFQNMPSKINKNEVIKSKKNDLFTSIVIKILDKVLAATPAVIEKLFGAGLTQLTNFGDDYSYGDSYGGYNMESGSSYDIQKLFKGFGFLGYGPLIFLKLIDGFTTIVNILKKNKFFKNFLIPALILLVVAGSVLFLVWWLQPNEDYYGYNHNSNDHGYDYSNKNYDHYSSNNNYQDNGYNKNNYYYVPNRSYNTPVYSRSYFDNGQRTI